MRKDSQSDSSTGSASRQKLLFLWLASSDLYSRVIGWSLFDGISDRKPSVDKADPPCLTAVDAMRDGWKVLQVPPLENRPPGQEFDADYLRYEVILERIGGASL